MGQRNSRIMEKVISDTPSPPKSRSGTPHGLRVESANLGDVTNYFISAHGSAPLSRASPVVSRVSPAFVCASSVLRSNRVPTHYILHITEAGLLLNVIVTSDGRCSKGRVAGRQSVRLSSRKKADKSPRAGELCGWVLGEVKSGRNCS